MFKIYSSVVLTVTFFFGFIPISVTASDCDILTSAFGYLKGKLLEDILLFSDCCNDVQITCSGQQITEIDVSGYEIPDADIGTAIKSLAGLNSLTKLKISNFETKTGLVIPNEIEGFKSLKTLILSGNKSSDSKAKGTSIPDVIGSLTTLEVLDLSSNNFIGSIPKAITKLTNLTSLNLQYNKLSGTVPYQLQELKNLKTLELNGNEELRGYVPLIPNVTKCNYSKTNLCYLKNTKCQSSGGCTIQEIQATNKENGAPNMTTYESEVVTNQSSSKKAAAGGGAFGFLTFCVICYCIYRYCCCRTTYIYDDDPIIDNTNINNNTNTVSNAGNNIVNVTIPSTAVAPPPAVNNTTIVYGNLTHGNGNAVGVPDPSISTSYTNPYPSTTYYPQYMPQYVPPTNPPVSYVPTSPVPSAPNAPPTENK